LISFRSLSKVGGDRPIGGPRVQKVEGDWSQVPRGPHGRCACCCNVIMVDVHANFTVWGTAGTSLAHLSVTRRSLNRQNLCMKKNPRCISLSNASRNTLHRVHMESNSRLSALLAARYIDANSGLHYVGHLTRVSEW